MIKTIEKALRCQQRRAQKNKPGFAGAVQRFVNRNGKSIPHEHKVELYKFVLTDLEVEENNRAKKEEIVEEAA